MVGCFFTFELYVVCVVRCLVCWCVVRLVCILCRLVFEFVVVVVVFLVIIRVVWVCAPFVV